MTGLMMTWRFGVLRCAFGVSNVAACSRIGTRRSQVNFFHRCVRAEYDELVNSGKLLFNPYQSSAVDNLQKLQDTLATYEPPAKQRDSWKWVCLASYYR